MLSKNITLELKKIVMPTGHQIVPLFTTGEIWKFEATVVKLDLALIRMSVLNAYLIIGELLSFPLGHETNTY